jgi:outer membrane receptor protein involved in Fe transport
MRTHRRFTPLSGSLLLFGLITVLLPPHAEAAAVAAGVTSEPVIVVGRRDTIAPYEAAYAPLRLDADWLRAAPQRRLDEALRMTPGFGLFRRNGSRFANPTAQGTSLRGLGPNGAGRTAVLVDGVPANDPFGGWVYWSRLPTALIEDVIIAPGAGAGPWGNSALAGVVRIRQTMPEGTIGEATAAGRGGYALALAAGAALDEEARLALAVQGFSGAGYHTLAKADRGPIDRPGDARSINVEARGARHLGDVAVEGKISGFAEERGGGTVLTGNETRAAEASLRLKEVDRAWEAIFYWRDWRFASQFSAIAAGRASETPSLDQYNVPARTVGGIVQVHRPDFLGGTRDIGIDLRFVEGETRERLNPQGGVFRRVRKAGGKQVLSGAFIEQDWRLTPMLALALGLRGDYLANRAGQRLESDASSGALLRKDRFADQDYLIGNGRLGLTWLVDAGSRLSVAAYSGFRLPTLNELYRPFRIGNDITEANASLKPERLYGTEIAGHWAATSVLDLSWSLFATQLARAVDNVVIQRTPGLNADLGVFVPAGGRLSQRLGLPGLRALGAQAGVQLVLADHLRLRIDYLLSDSSIRIGSTKNAALAGLDGNRPGQSSRHQGSLGLVFQPPDGPIAMTGHVRAASGAFEDSGNLQRLAGYVTADFGLEWRLHDRVSLFASVENLADHRIETGKRADGLTSFAPPRQWLIGLRIRQGAGS